MPLLYRSKNESVIQQIVVENLIHGVFIDGTPVSATLGSCIPKGVPTDRVSEMPNK